MPLLSPDKQNEELNPGQRNADHTLDNLSKVEGRGTADTQPGSIDMSDFERNYQETAEPGARIRQEEAQGSAPQQASGAWATNVDTPNAGGGRFKSRLKKASPALGIGGVLGFSGLMMLALTSPSLLVVHIKEIMTDKFNTQLSSMQARSDRLLLSKLDTATSGVCTSKVTIKCKFTSMSDKQVEKFKAAGIEIESDSKTIIKGRAKPISFKFKGETIRASDFASVAKTNPEFRSALRQAYNPKYAGFVGKAWSNVATRFKISKATPDLKAEEDPAKALEIINETAKEGVEDVARGEVIGDPPNCEGPTCTGISEEEAAKINSNATAIENSLADGSSAADVRSKLSGIGIGQAASFIKITGFVDSACQVYGLRNALSYAAKTLRAQQLVRYAMIFFGMADTIKAGKSPKPADIEVLGNILTSTTKDPKDPTNTLVGSATDSYGYKFAAYGDTNAPEKSMTIANRFIAGGGFVGKMSTATDAIINLIPGGKSGAKNTCGTLSNPLVQGGSLVLGVASLFIPGVNVAKIAAQASISVTVGIVISVLPSLIADIIAGTVTKDITGEESGNAITSGAGALISDALAGQNGNAPMTKQDAVAYNSLQTETNNQYIADELRTTSPFDTTNSHTFLGSIVSNLIPLQSSSNPITAIGSLLATSVKNLVPSSNALSTQQYSESLNICQDPDVIDANYAADPFCNVVRGIPPQYLNIKPELVADKLLAEGDITEEGEPVENYKKFIADCITTANPLGYGNAEAGFDKDSATKCIISNQNLPNRSYSNAYYYLFYMDGIVDSGFDGDYGEASATTNPVPEGELPSGSAPELAQLILSSGKVSDRTGQLKQIVDGSRTDVSPSILSVVAALSATNTFTISSLKRDQALSVGGGNSSLHLQGSAVDISGSAGVNGASFGYNGTSPVILAFATSAAAVLPANCQIGLPNQAYVNVIKPKAKPGCSVFVDKGTGAHIHLAVRSG